MILSYMRNHRTHHAVQLQRLTPSSISNCSLADRCPRRIGVAFSLCGLSPDGNGTRASMAGLFTHWLFRSVLGSTTSCRIWRLESFTKIGAPAPSVSLRLRGE